MSSDPPQATALTAGDGPVDHRKRPRRRGQALQEAIFAATMAELSEAGYAGLTMDRVAERARTSKASLYRRWPGRAELVIDAIRGTLSGREELPDTGDLRADILTLLRRGAERFAGPVGEAARGLLVDTLRDPELGREARARIIDSGSGLMLEILRRGAARGEVRPGALTPRVAGVAVTLLRHHFLVHGAPIPDEVLTEIVDDVVLPLVSPDPRRRLIPTPADPHAG